MDEQENHVKNIDKRILTKTQPHEKHYTKD